MFSGQLGAHQPTRPQLLLVVDDDVPLVDVLVELLETAGYPVVRAYSGQEALEVIARRPLVALVLSDMRMPGMSGLELAARIHERWPAIRIVMMSGYPNVPNHLLRFIAKPFRMGALLHEVEQELSTTVVRP